MNDSSPKTELISLARPLFDEAQLAVVGFLACYRGNTRAGYRTDLRAGSPGAPGTTWPCSTLAALELWARTMEEHQHLRSATVSRRLSTVAGFYRSP